MRIENTQLWRTGSLAQCSGADARRDARAAAGAFRSFRGLRLTADTFVRSFIHSTRSVQSVGRFATAQREQALKLGNAAQRAFALRAFSVLLMKLLESVRVPPRMAKRTPAHASVTYDQARLCGR